jgi:hypothetical protein
MRNSDAVLDAAQVCRLEVGDTAGWKPALPRLWAADPPLYYFGAASFPVDFHAQVVLWPAGAEDEFGLVEFMGTAKLHGVAEAFEAMGLFDAVGLLTVGLEKHLRIATSQSSFHGSCMMHQACRAGAEFAAIADEGKSVQFGGSPR